MSKNLTRKGYAFGALVALGASVFAGAPAYAADSIVLAGDYTADTTLATAITETYTLNASLAPGSTAANISQLKYKVANNGALTVVATPATGGVSTGSTAATVASGADPAYATLASNNLASPTAKNTLAISLTGATFASTTQTVTVTAFLDANGNGLVESGETQATQTVTFVKYADITTTTAITAPTQGNTSAVAVVKFANINNQSLANANVSAYFTKGDGGDLGAAPATAVAVSAAAFTASAGAVTVTTGTQAYAANDAVVVAGVTPSTLNGYYILTAAPSTTSISFANITAAASVTVAGTVKKLDAAVLKTATYTSADAGFKFTTGTITALAKSTAVKVQPILRGQTVGTAQTAQVATRVLGEFGGNTVLSTTAALGTVTGGVTTPSSSTVASDVALNSEKSVAFLAKDTATVKAALAGVATAVSVDTSVTLSSTKTLTINGTTYTSTSSLPGKTGIAKLALTTGADGKAVVTYKTAGFAYGDTVTFVGSAENSTATIQATERTRNFVGSAVTGDGFRVANSTYIANHEGDTATTVDGTAVAVNVVVQDQFGGAPADGTYQVTASFTSSSQSSTAATSASATYAAVVGGKATLSILDNGTGLGNNVYAIDLREVASNGVLSSSVKTIAAAFTIKIASAADVAAGEVVLSGTGISASATTGIYSVAASTGANSGSSTAADKGALTYSTLSSVDGRAIAVTAPSNTDLASGAVTAVQFSGTVNSASTSTYGGVAVPGASVTVSATGAQFSVTQDGAAIYGAGSLTFVANATGQFTVSVWSSVAGKNSITVKSGTGSAVIELWFADAAESAASAVSVTVADGAAQFQAGRALDVVIKVTDKLGNPVAIDTAYSATAGEANKAKVTIAQTGAGYLSLSGDQATGAAGTFTTKLITNAGDLGTSSITVTVDFYDSTKTDLVKAVSSEFGVTDADVTVGGRAVYASVEFAKGKTVTVSVDGRRLYSKLFSTDAYTELKFTQKKAGKHTVTVRVSGGIVYSEVVTTTK